MKDWRGYFSERVQRYMPNPDGATWLVVRAGQERQELEYQLLKMMMASVRDEIFVNAIGTSDEKHAAVRRADALQMISSDAEKIHYLADAVGVICRRNPWLEAA